MEADCYKTILKPNEESLFKDRGSKFYGYAFHVKTEDEVQVHIDTLKQEHHKARHWCYAYQLGKQYDVWRANDDGEPNNSAGMPIYDQLQSFELTNSLIVVVRYFGGTKLGVGGLINAYRTAAQMAVEASKIATRTINQEYVVLCDYKELNKVMRIIKEHNLKVTNQVMEMKCELTISVREKEAANVFNIFDGIFGIDIKVLED